MQFFITAILAGVAIHLLVAAQRRLRRAEGSWGCAVVAGLLGALVGGPLGFLALMASLATNPTQSHPAHDHFYTEGFYGLFIGLPVGALLGAALAVTVSVADPPR